MPKLYHRNNIYIYILATSIITGKSHNLTLRFLGVLKRSPIQGNKSNILDRTYELSKEISQTYRMSVISQCWKEKEES